MMKPLDTPDRSLSIDTSNLHIDTGGIELAPLEETLAMLSRQESFLPPPPPKPARAAASEVTPAVPQSITETGLAETLIEQLILKILYFRGELLGRELADQLGLKFSVIEDVIEDFKRSHLVSVKRSLGVGDISALFTLSEAGRTLAKEYLEACQYAGRAPVPLSQYSAVVRAQRLESGWLTWAELEKAFQHMVITRQALAQIGPAVNSGKSFLIYGQPGNGKTYMAEAIFQIEASDIFIPYAIESQGMIIQMFDPLYHKPIDEPVQESSIFTNEAVSDDVNFDRRWFKAQRPFIVTGGELTLEMLDLSFNPLAKFYDAPLQLKANNGIYLVDDFGRQRTSPAEILNRWIIPMERHVDYMTFQNGSKTTVPFECFLIFSTNLRPDSLGDEAFLRRIQYKMLVKGPTETEFREIFRRYAQSKDLSYESPLLDRFMERHYRASGKPRRRCHPRDVLNHALDLISFEQRPYQLTDEVLDTAFESCFLHEEEE
jgi:predicted ATPase with chaperone activity